MAIRRIVPNLLMHESKAMSEFYRTVLGLELVMDMDWILTFCGDEPGKPQLSIAKHGGEGLPLPSASIEVDDVEEVYARANNAKSEIVRDLQDESWGVRRFLVRDPDGNLLNILQHV